MVAVNPPSSAAVVDIADDLLEKYVAQGWTAVDAKPETVKRRPGRPKKSE